MIPDDHIFVFGSNLAGIHGAGAARYAYAKYGARKGQYFGMSGDSFAIPTKDASIKNTLPLSMIETHVRMFLDFAQTTYIPGSSKQTHVFKVTRIGCGLAGLKDKDIAPMFKDHTPNCWFDDAWKEYLPEGSKFWGTF